MKGKSPGLIFHFSQLVPETKHSLLFSTSPEPPRVYPGISVFRYPSILRCLHRLSFPGPGPGLDTEVPKPRLGSVIEVPSFWDPGQS